MADSVDAIKSALTELADQLGAETIIDLIEVYTDNSAEQILKIEAARDRGDLKGITSEAHSLKSSSANMGATILAEACRSLEQTKDISPATNEQIAQVRSLREQAAKHMLDWKAQQTPG